MIDYLIEIIFKDISAEKIVFLLDELTYGGKKIVTYNFTCKTSQIKCSVFDLIKKTFMKNKQFGLFINLSDLLSNDCSLPKCGLAVYKNETNIDLELNFQLSDLKNLNPENLVNKLMKFSKSIASRYDIKDYFCGIEPAEDKNTRLFTKEQLGPLFLKSEIS